MANFFNWGYGQVSINDLNWCVDLSLRVISQKYLLNLIFIIGELNDWFIPFRLYLARSLLAFFPIYFDEKGFFSKVKSKWFSSQVFSIFFLCSFCMNFVNSFDFGDIYWTPWSKLKLSLNLLLEDLPPGPLALSKTFTEYFLDNRFAIVEPDIPYPRIQKSIILQTRIRIFR